MKGFIEVRVLSNEICNNEIKQIEKLELISLSDIARVYDRGTIVLRTPYGNGQNYTLTTHTYEEIKELIKNAR